ncbi:hypothetical protein MTO96_048475 [Rhipicephalus appendiculatus]
MVLGQLERILRHNASVNFYMFHGGTNFGFKNGANPPAQPTSYDYGAPLTEAGDPTPTYFKIREIVGPLRGAPEGGAPSSGTKVEARGREPQLVRVAGRHSRNRGYVLTAHTRAVLSSDHYVTSTPVVVHPGEDITILVENTGRINYDRWNHDMKGIIANVTLGRNVLSGWTMEPLPLDASHVIRHLIDVLGRTSVGRHCTAPGAFFGTFVLPKAQKVLDTYLDPTGWGKGAAYVNGFNLGRYWPSIGPQVTLYVPGVLLHPYPKINTILLFETEYTPPGRSNG